MGMIETITLRDSWDIERRLSELQLGPRYRLLEVAKVALSAGRDATLFHPANAAGTFSYQHGTWALREEFVNDSDWRLDRPNGVEVIRDDELKVMVAFANVDVACDDDLKPKPRSRKGAGAERVCVGNLFGTLPEYAPRQPGGWATYYLMVDEKGAVEFTRPVISNGTFTAWIERLYLSIGGDLDREPILEDDGDMADDFDPKVIRK